jgi:hypothetical protein
MCLPPGDFCELNTIDCGRRYVRDQPDGTHLTTLLSTRLVTAQSDRGAMADPLLHTITLPHLGDVSPPEA